MRNREESVRIFKNPLLELTTKAHPIFPLLFWGPVAIISFLLGMHYGVRISTSLIAILIGIFSWTFFEYLLHRYFFHFKPKSEWLKKLHYYVHQFHHDHCQDWYRLVAPPMMSVTLGTLFLLAFQLVFLGNALAWPFYAGFIIGYMAYDYVHLYTHFTQPKSKIGQILRRHHLQHHFAWPDRWYGVSSPLWDYIFRTHVPSHIRPVSKRPEQHN